MPTAFSLCSSPSLEILRTLSSHCDRIANANGVILPCKHPLFLDSIFDQLSEVVHFREIRVNKVFTATSCFW
jgi:hypothetical protein